MTGAGDDVPDLGPVPRRIAIEDATVRALIADQFPRWRDLPLARVEPGGWDNVTHRLGDDLSVRLPSAAEYALAVAKERRCLPVLAAHLTLPIPQVRGVGEPGAGYPFAWSVRSWLPGVPATTADVDGPLALAGALADFLMELRGIDPTDGPRPGIHNWFRGATLRTYDATARAAIAELSARDVPIDLERVRRSWDASLAAPWDGVDRWFHGDLAAGNLLLEDGRLAGVIDFGTCGVGDPACDLAVAWTLLTGPGRDAFRDGLGVDDAEWVRGRGWALWKTLSRLSAAIADADEAEAAAAGRVIEAIVAES